MFRRLFIRLAGTASHSGDTAVPCHAARRRGKVTAWRGHYGAVEDAATRRSYFVHRRALVTEPSEGSVALRLRTAVEFDLEADIPADARMGRRGRSGRDGFSPEERAGAVTGSSGFRAANVTLPGRVPIPCLTDAESYAIATKRLTALRRVGVSGFDEAARNRAARGDTVEGARAAVAASAAARLEANAPDDPRFSGVPDDTTECSGVDDVDATLMDRPP